MDFYEISGETAIEEAVATIDQPKKLVICGDAEERENLEEQLSEVDDPQQTVAAILAEAEDLDILLWFSDRWDEYVEDYEVDEDELLGEWPDNVDKHQFILNTDITTGQTLDWVFAVEIETAESWQLPAYFNVGGWNECPEPDLHCAIWRYWQATYGAHIIGMSHDVIEAKVLKPPQTEEQAIELAWQHYLYCMDTVEQGVQSISSLAASLQNHDSWYFWWD